MSITSGSGLVKFTPEAEEAFAKVNFGVDNTWGAVLRFVDDTTVDLDRLIPRMRECDDRKKQWEELSKDLHDADGCRYVLAKFPYLAKSDGVVRSKTVMVMWAPEHSTTVRERTLFSMFARGINQKMETSGGAPFVTIQAGSAGCMDFNDVEEKIRVKATVK